VTQFLFFSGKGGVGKTTMACTTAVAEADAGTRVLIVTTDPASNLADVFEQPIGHAITPIAGVPNLWAMEIDPDRATAEYTDRTLAPIREIFPPEIVRVMEEQLAGPCTAEVAAFDRFADFLDPGALEVSSETAFDLVIFDTAPTGHTVRLLELPEAWSKSISEAEAGSGQTCIGPAAAIADAKVKYERALAALRDGERTRFAFVLQPEATAIAETIRASAELARLGIETTELIVNGILPAEEALTPFFAARIAMQERYLAEIARQLPMPTRPSRSSTARSVASPGCAPSCRCSPTRALRGRFSAPGAIPPHGLGRTIPIPHSRRSFRTAVRGPCSSPARAASARPSSRARPP
jgi:arsenite-activated ATPase ArsA